MKDEIEENSEKPWEGKCFKEKKAFHSGISGAAKRLKTAFSSGKLVSTHMKTGIAGRERTGAS